MVSEIRRDIVCFFRGHWPHLLLAVPMAVVFTVLHELAHCVAVWLQGGSVDAFVWLPSGAEWGHMRYSCPAGTQVSAPIVSLAPYTVWLAACLVASILSRRKAQWAFWASSTIFVWLFVAPLADIANTTVPYMLLDSANDFRNAMGPVDGVIVVEILGAGILLACSGFSIHKRLYRGRAVGMPAYCVLVAVGLAVVLGLTV
jgi:hypothetical protein